MVNYAPNTHNILDYQWQLIKHCNQAILRTILPFSAPELVFFINIRHKHQLLNRVISVLPSGGFGLVQS